MPEYITKNEPIDKKPYIVYTDDKRIVYAGDPDADIPGGGGGGSLGATIMLGASTESQDTIMAEYRIGIGESVAAVAFAPEAISAAIGAFVAIVIAEIDGHPVTGNETVTAEFRTDDNQIAFTDFAKSFKDDALHIEFTMPNVDADLFLAFTVSAAK
jgi:hypothetical protein